MKNTAWPVPLLREQAEKALKSLHSDEEGLATAEYGIVMLAAVGFAGLLTAILTSDTVRGLLESVVQNALSH
ncbi:DUF4244 domain-containing protein [Nesterenkonia flava]|uniref:DUF4244 domain-containing protein n=1 Tax=Nesterenkonia flava TaxID=469799 RepID=A0ABU1FUI2_9MICC|nr:DUF4244 domain-containing protein [Nesterenkonia flava]MDR5712319.1 DUF4244 domain-containing protein [Nesterenkonia flava]